MPKGQTFHAAGPSGDGWVIFAVYDDKATWESWRDETLMPGLAGTEGALVGPPEETGFEIHRQQS